MYQLRNEYHDKYPRKEVKLKKNKKMERFIRKMHQSASCIGNPIRRVKNLLTLVS